MKKTFCEGFTLVELALSMAFVGVLSVIIVLVIANTVSSYRRGLTVAQVNTTGIDIVDDMRLAVSNSSSKAVSSYCERVYQGENSAKTACENDGAYSFVTIVRKAGVRVLSEDLKSVPIYGAFCTGTYSYIWNSGYYDMEQSGEGAAISKEEGGWATLTYMDGNGKKITIVGSLRNNNDFTREDGKIGDPDRPFRLLKVRDDKRSVCMSVAKNGDDRTYKTQALIEEEFNGVFDISDYGILNEEPEDLILADSDNDLALFSLDVARPAESTTQKNMFYAVSFILGTVKGGVNIMTPGRSCEPPSNYDIDNFDYCAINKFSFAMQASGNGGVL